MIGSREFEVLVFSGDELLLVSRYLRVSSKVEGQEADRRKCSLLPDKWVTGYETRESLDTPHRDFRWEPHWNKFLLCKFLLDDHDLVQRHAENNIITQGVNMVD